MDIGRWGDSRGRFLLRYILLVFCLLNHAASTEDSFPPVLENQDLKNESPESINKLHPSYDQEDYKRASSFFPLRGKKNPFDESIYSELEESEDKRSQFFPLRGKKVPDDYKRASYFMPMRGRKDGSWTDDYEDEFDDEKRASSFMPMRGKKRSSAVADIFPQLGKAGMYLNSFDQAMPAPIYNIGPDKRMSSFVPSRGKRSQKASESAKINQAESNSSILEESANHLRNKRSVSFMPMRGRSLESGFGGGEIKTSILEKKKHSFMPMRGHREPYSEDTNSSFSDSLEEDDDLSMSDKRASYFMPMRGRSDNSIMDEIDTGNKRVQSFMPMRGRSDSSLLDEIDTEDKRAQSFMPMRGRRLAYTERLEDKRANYFMPMRGKKQWLDVSGSDGSDETDFDSFDKKASSFTLMRGRRMVNSEDESFSNSKRVTFMPMRGRKDQTDTQNIDWNTDQYKRSSSFMPMRGRRHPEEEDYSNELDFPQNGDKRASSFMPMRGRRQFSDFSDSIGYYHPYPFYISGIGSSLMSRGYGEKTFPISRIINPKKKVRINWDSVKRAFHATRGKRMHHGESVEDSSRDQDFLGMPELVNDEVSAENQQVNTRVKRSLIPQQISLQPQKQYIALKRPMSFFATRGKRFDGSTVTFPKLR
ncbi:uncharacterized protein LOC129229503 [Uloborus diversus]|uniref:uncharacterized protein LOC129229503 n=1 Tax=Uloborus diversus TaxID=327109 RepID=UPI00240A591A|nr:uncharacterized protein LOC129229503 [Uloborus diversus]